MRLWHKDLIKILPDKLLYRQWLECERLGNQLFKDHRITDPLIKRVLDYDINHFVSYCYCVKDEIVRRDMKLNFDKLFDNLSKIADLTDEDEILPLDVIFPNWHNFRYYNQCCCFIAELYDCGVISQREWDKFEEESYKVIYNPLTF